MKIVCTLRLINFNFYTALLGRVCLCARPPSHTPGVTAPRARARGDRGVSAARACPCGVCPERVCECDVCVQCGLFSTGL